MSPTKSCTSHGKKTDEIYVTKQIDDVFHEANSNMTADRMLGRYSKRKLFPVCQNDRHDVNAHIMNDNNIHTKLQGTTTNADT